MLRNAAGQCQQILRRRAVASSQSVRHASFSPLQNVTNTSRTQRRKSFTHLIRFWQTTHSIIATASRLNETRSSYPYLARGLPYYTTKVWLRTRMSSLACSGAKCSFRVCSLLAVSTPPLTHSKLSAGSRSYVAHLQGENGYTLNQVPGRSLQARRNPMPRSMA